MKISISKPCHENWETMILDGKDKFCHLCSKTVHDFTNSSDDEIINSIEADKNICGRFLDDQVGRNLNFSIINKIALGLLTTGGMLSTINAQELKNEEVKKVDFKKGLKGVEVINDTINRTVWLGMPSKKDLESSKPLIMLDNRKISETKMKKINPDNIKSIKVLSGEGAKKLYGSAGERGVIVIESKGKE